MRVNRVLSMIVGCGVLVVGVMCCGGVGVAAGPPEAPVTEPASGVTSGSAVLNGTLNPHADATAGWYFEYGTEPACPEALASPLEAEALVQAQVEHFEVTGLEPHKLYGFCLVAASGEGSETTAGASLTFETLAVKPSVDSEGVSGVSSSDAILEAQVNPNNQETKYVFQYATSANGETLTNPVSLPAGSIQSGYGDQLASTDIGGGLVSVSTYYYRVIAENATGITEGPVQSFTTAGVPLASAGTAGLLRRTRSSCPGA